MGDIKAAHALMDDPQSSDGLIIRARLGLIENTTKALIDALQIKSDPRLWTLLGQFQDMEGQSMTARQSYAMAGLAGARPGLADNNIGQSFLTEGAFESALKAFSKAAKADPFDVQFDNNRRRVLINLGETHQAIAGLPPERAAIFLEQAADQAMVDREVKLAQYLYRKSLDLSPRYNPKVAEKLELAKH